MRTRHSLQQLLQRIAENDQRAFFELYETTSAKLFGVAMRILRDTDKAADATQEAYLQIWRHADKFSDKKGALEAWMVSIVRFRAIDALRRERSYAAVIEPLADGGHSGAASAFPESLQCEANMQLADCMGRLSAEQRSAVVDAHLYGFTQEELAQRYDTPLGTMKSRIRRGLISLKECLEQ